MNRKRRAVTAAKGFTLIEVVVALAILGISIAIVMQIFAGGLKNLHRIDLAHRAMSHGENVMNAILSDPELVDAGSLSGELDDDFRYTAEITDWESPEDQGLSLDLTDPGIRLLQVTVVIHFVNNRFGKMYRLTSLKAISEEPIPGSLAEGGNPLQQRPRGNVGIN